MTPTQTTYNDIMQRAATLCDMDVYEAHNGKTHNAARARRIAWFVLNEHLGWPRRVIARHCKWNRITVTMGIEVVADLPSQSDEGQIIQALIKSLHC
jgi:hypothetical protein